MEPIVQDGGTLADRDIAISQALEALQKRTGSSTAYQCCFSFFFPFSVGFDGLFRLLLIQKGTFPHRKIFLKYFLSLQTWKSSAKLVTASR